MYEEELRALRPKANELMEEYHNRFMAYIDILDISSEKATEIFYNSLPDHFKMEIDCFRFQSTNYNEVITDFGTVMEHLQRIYQTPQTYCYIKQKGHTQGEGSEAKNNPRRLGPK